VLPERFTEKEQLTMTTRAGDVSENPVTGERGVILVGLEESNGELLIVDLHVRPGGAVVGAHTHPAITETFTILAGRVGVQQGRDKRIATPGERLTIPPGVVHDWWNAGDDEARVLVEIQPAARFDAMARNLFGLAQDGKTNAKGMPNLLQIALIAREFDDTVRFTKPPRFVQRILFGALAPIASTLGYRGSYPAYLAAQPSEVVDAAKVIEEINQMGLWPNSVWRADRAAS
jgi:quercetin dioxygenase-like cupin family protein